jgi:hypothetical protein
MPTISGGDLACLTSYSIPILVRNEIFLKCSSMIIKGGEMVRIRSLFIEMLRAPDIHPMLLESILEVTKDVQELQDVRQLTKYVLNKNVELLEFVRRQSERFDNRNMAS